jgi:hypothetical protein
MCFVILGSNQLSFWHLPQTRQGAPYGVTPRRFNSICIASKRISAGMTARFGQKMIAAREGRRWIEEWVHDGRKENHLSPWS